MTKIDIAAAANARYSTKSFDPNKKISDEDFAQIQTVMRMSASSVNSQPWHMIVASTDAGKARMLKGVIRDFAYNGPKIANASHVVLFCTRTDMGYGC